MTEEEREVISEGEKLFFTHYVEYVDNRLRRFFVKLLIAFAVLGFCMAAAVLYINHISDQTHRGLCALKTTAASQIKQTNDFIKDHPDGFAGLSTAVLMRSLEASKRTVKSLKDVNCSDG